MRTFLGVFMVLFVSGDDEIVSVTGVLDGTVLLPCSCSERNLDQEFKWQMEEPNKMVVLIHNKTHSNFDQRYQDRANVFLPENSNNCSILLTKITADDAGLYRCRFHSQETYKKSYVNLSISASHEFRISPTQPPNPELRSRYLITFPIMLVLGSSLLFWLRWKQSKRLLRRREVETYSV